MSTDLCTKKIIFNSSLHSPTGLKLSQLEVKDHGQTTDSEAKVAVLGGMPTGTIAAKQCEWVLRILARSHSFSVVISLVSKDKSGTDAVNTFETYYTLFT